jgi:hypothetical protein
MIFTSYAAVQDVFDIMIMCFQRSRITQELPRIAPPSTAADAAWWKFPGGPNQVSDHTTASVSFSFFPKPANC